MLTSPLEKVLLQLASRSRFTSFFFAQADFAADPNIPTLALLFVKGRMRVWYNPDFFAQTDPEHLIGLLVHEMLHVAANHRFRALAGADPALQNLSQDMVVNSYCEKAARSFFAKKGRGEAAVLALPPGLPRVPEELAARAGGLFALRWEEVYGHLAQRKRDAGEEQGAGFFDLGPAGTVSQEGGEREGLLLADKEGKTLPAGVHLFGRPEEAGRAEAAARRVLLFALEKAPAKGERIVGELSALMEEPAPVRLAWKSRLRALVRGFSPAARWDLSRSRPNRRFWDAGIYAPGRALRQEPAVTAVVDVSGSVAARPGALAAAFGVVEELAKSFRVTLLCLDQDLFVPARGGEGRAPAAQARPNAYRRGDWKRLASGSRGATFFAPLFNEYMPGRRGALVVVTDGEVYDLAALRPYPATVWALPEDLSEGFTPPFGVKVAVPGE